MSMTLSRPSAFIGHKKQTGVVLIITLIVLVAMTLATIALVRSVDTTNVIAGNLAFHSAATDATDIGIVEASAMLSQLQVNSPATLILCSQTTNCPAGYRSKFEPHLEPPYPNTTWDSYWGNVSGNARNAANPPPGYTVAYVIERMCNNNLPNATCYTSVPLPNLAGIGCSVDQPGDVCAPIILTYYRVTAKVTGPRNTTSYVQTILAM